MSDNNAQRNVLHTQGTPGLFPMLRLKSENLELLRRSWLCALPPVTKLVLQAYCLHASKRLVCWQSLARTAALTGLNQRTVQRHIRTLETAGVLVPLNHARAACRVYRMNLDALGPEQTLPYYPDDQQTELDGMDAPQDLHAPGQHASDFQSTSAGAGADKPMPKVPGLGDLPDLSDWPDLQDALSELDFTLDLDLPDLPGLGDGLPPLPELPTPCPVDNLTPGGGTVSPHPRQRVRQGVTESTKTPGTAPPKLNRTDKRTDEGTDGAAHAPTLPALATPPSPLTKPQASPASRFAFQQENPEAQAQTLARFAALHQRKGHGPVTDATLQALRAEGELAGLTLTQVLAHCVERRWGTFKALWLHKPCPTPENRPTPPAGAWTVPGGGQPSPAPDLTPAGRAAARVLADLQAATQQPPASPERVAHHRARLAELRSDYTAAGARVRPASAARAAAMH